ncbi:phage baseplate upper protein [Bacillus haynesii]|uniref:phage baseplate upper protein n=1 Tax=Bacillus haynesii TaxID=1925021 RepID=UPI00228133AE|nr:phage baseplate upper protein [Bacillus haynesii]MCY9372723.1 phage baseplate upper protein [Bacillus haynesii]
MIYKNTDVQFEINSQIKRSISANIQFSTQDIDTAKLTFSLTKDGVPLPISKATHGKLFMRFADGSKFYVNTEVKDALEGVIFYVLTPDQVTHYGTVQAELYVNYNNGQSLSVHKFSFEIDRALVDQDIAPVAEYYVQDFESLKAVIQEMADDAEQILTELQAKFETLDNIETKEGAQEKADAAEAGAKAYTDEHAAKTNNPHKVTKSQVGLSNLDNVKQATKAEFDAHTADNVRHITADERTTWNKGQLFKITKDDGQPLVYVNATDDFHELLPRYKGFVHFSSNPNAINGPGGALRGFWSCNATGTYGQIIAFDNSNRTLRKSITNGVWSDWAAVITSADAVVTWQTPTLLNGWRQYDTEQKVRFSKNALGEVEILGSIKGGTLGFEVSAFQLPEGFRPLQPSHFIGVASSVGMGSAPQFHRTLVDTDGKVCVQYCSNTVNPNEFISFGFKFRTT